MKSILLKVMCFALIAMFGIMPCVTSFNVTETAPSIDSKLFTDVTGEVDLSGITMSNLSQSVLSGTVTSSYSTHTVIVGLSGKNLVEEADGKDVSEYALTKEGQRKTKALEKAQDKFLSRLTDAGVAYELKNRYTVVANAVAIEINTKYVSAIKKMSGVESVVLSERYSYPESVDMGSYASATEAEMDEALQSVVAVVNKTSVYQTGVYDSSSVMDNYGYKGGGSVVAIIDTGLDYTHNAFIWDEEHESKYTLANSEMNKDKVESIMSEKNLLAEQRSALNGDKISANDVYVSQKVPFAYDYADNDTDVYPSYSNHGTHVAGIVAGYDPDGYTDKNGNHVDEAFVGVAPEAQLVICKVFSDDMDDADVGGADSEDILAALEDCVLLGVDVINMSLGTSCGFSTTADGDEEGEELNRVYNMVGQAGISLVCAASNDYSAAYGGTFGTNKAENPDSGTVGSPSVFAAALSVASISGKTSPYMIANAGTDSQVTAYYEESSDQYNKYYEFSEMILGNKDSETFEYVVVPGVGLASEYAMVADKLDGKIALVKRGNSTFKEKVELAKSYGAIGIIVYNNVAGTIRMALGEVEDPIPSCCISMDAGEAMVAYAKQNGSVGKITIDKSLMAGPFMSEFSSWGVTPDLKLKPEITAHGGEITSAVPGGYGEQSGTSMASPNMAGVVSIIRSYLKTTQPDLTTNQLTQRINQLIMSTANIVYDKEGLPYSPRKQGAGLGSLDNAISTRAYLYTDDASIDYRPLRNLGDDATKIGVYTVNFSIANFGSEDLSFKVNPIFMTETLAIDNIAVAEKAHLLDDEKFVWYIGTEKQLGDTVTVKANESLNISVTLTLSADEKEYIETSFKNGMYVEGFINLISESGNQCSLTLPFMGFYGDWTDAPMLDYSAYEVDDAKQDTSIADEDKPQASIWATQPFTTYYNDEYSMPMGSFAYLQDPDADQIYTTMDHNAVSCYNEFYGEDDPQNYLTAYQFRGLYVGLQRGARKVEYELINSETGEVLYQNTAYRINKAYSQGGSGGVPGYIKFEIPPLEYGMVSNGKYEMNFRFYLDYGDEDRTEPDETFNFYFYADYDAPVIEDVRVRYNTYKDGNKEKQRIYLDLDVYDNHYPQAALLCYYDSVANELKQVTDYVVPIRSTTRNSTTTVSIEITDIYDQYKQSGLYVQVDDYALNHSVYALDLTQASVSVTPDKFELADGEKDITLDIFETHKVSLKEYDGSANISNFSWSSDKMSVAQVKNGEIVGIGEGEAVITVRSSSGFEQKINVKVTSNEKKLNIPTLSFGTISDYDDNIVLADSSGVSLYPDQDVTLTIKTDPWYYPTDRLNVVWSSTDDSIVSVNNGKLTFGKKGTASVIAQLLDSKGNITAYSAVVKITVLDPFVVSGYTLTHYRGTDKNVEIPDDEMIMYIGEDCFEYNNYIETVIIPKTVLNIGEHAFVGCTNLKEVYFVSKEKQEIADADLNLVYRYAFQGCTSLELVDLSNVKVITLGHGAFAGCTSLKEIRKMSAIGTAFNGVFSGCTSLTSVDITGMHVSGTYVFSGCTKLSDVTTGKFTAIGDGMFSGCTSLKKITLNNAIVGSYAFQGCTKLTTVEFANTEDNCVIGVGAFKDSGLNKVTFNENVHVRYIGSQAFANTKLKNITLPEGLTEIGSNLFAGCLSLKEIVLPASFDFEQIKLSGSLFNSATVKLSDESAYTIDDGLLYNKDKTVLYALMEEKNSVSIPDSVETISDYAFADSSIVKITIPESVRYIGVGAFKGSSLTNITFNGSTIEQISNEAFRDTQILSIVLPDSVKSIGQYAFAESKIESIVFGNNVESIGAYAFMNCEKLAEVTISEGVESVGDYAFYGCTALEEIAFPAVKEMGECVLVGANSLKKLEFGAKSTTIGEYTLVNKNVLVMYTLVEIVEPELGKGEETLRDYEILKAYEQLSSVINWQSYVGLPALEEVKIACDIDTISDYYFMGCSSLKKVDIGRATVIGNYAFTGCSALSEINLANVVTVGNMAFNNCNALTTVELPNVKTIGTGAFAMDNGKGGIKSISAPVVETISTSAFESTEIQSFYIGESVKEIGFGAFAYIESLKGLEISEKNEVFFLDNGVLYRNLPIGGYELISYPLARENTSDTFTILEGTVRISAYAFVGLERDVKVAEADDEIILTKVILPHTVAYIGDSAFYQSGIIEYTFESVNAPVLESVYKEAVNDILLDYQVDYSDPAINSYYYSNFNTLFVYYINMIGQESELVMNYPSNGVGYDNFVYSRYFGVKNKANVVMDDTTRDFLNKMDEFVSDDVLNAWINAAQSGDQETYKEAVEEFSNLVQEARRLYASIRDDAQLEYIDTSFIEKLEQAEIKLREQVKPAYGIAVKITNFSYTEGSYKKDYIEGEYFDMTGLEVIIHYSDGSTAIADSSKLTLITTGELKNYNLDVTVKYADGDIEEEFWVVVNVKTADSNSSSGSSGDSPNGGNNGVNSGSNEGNGNNNGGENNGNNDGDNEGLSVGAIVGIAVSAVAVVAGAVVAVLMVLKKKKANGVIVDNEEPELKSEEPETEETIETVDDSEQNNEDGEEN